METIVSEFDAVKINEMNLFDVFFSTGPAIQVIFRLGFMPKEEEFHELTYEQYKAYFEQHDYTQEKVYMLIPVDPEKYKELALDGVFCMTESEKESLKSAARVIDNYCKDRMFSSYEDKLRYVASQMPDVFSKGTKFER